MFLLDTNVVSELRKSSSGRADIHVTEWARTLDQDTLFISVITILELETGILKVTRQDERQGRNLKRWFEDGVLPAFRGRTIPIDTETARVCARLHVPVSRPKADALIAATAILHNLTLVTRNEKDFLGTGVPMLNPWRPPAPSGGAETG